MAGPAINPHPTHVKASVVTRVMCSGSTIAAIIGDVMVRKHPRSPPKATAYTTRAE